MPRSVLSCRRAALAGLCLGLACVAAQAQWKWLDGRNQVQYSDLPPPVGTPERNILQRPEPPRVALKIGAAASAPASAASAAVPAASRVDPALEAKRREAEQQEAAKRKTDEERNALARAQNCERARAHLRTLDSGVRIGRTNAQGEREILDDRSRALETEQTRRLIASECR